ncbi:MAG: hypothetical protein C4532_19790 [Candidatus Abyssobacteria bacterium SURF_17]|uniref:Uncharacterized protein n=1 Tax=Candidatus Abyssobacteria bacterium SURF_17 TaxID=2093361 RepID=A0A419EN17_9BACT|nr:MAG: hypothetical protein C4532_19790 [Candidatus Abyssubacteria bacterium SURF_17]
MARDNTSADDALFNVPPDILKPGEPSESYLEQYKLYLSYLDKLADRRQSSNTFFLTLNTGLCAAIAFLCSKETAEEIRRLLFVIPFAGIVVSVFWHRLVASYRQLSNEKFNIVHRMEKHLPTAPYRAEWAALGSGKDSSKYVPLTQVEIWVPRLFITMYVMLVVYLFPWMRIIGMMKCSQQ